MKLRAKQNIVKPDLLLDEFNAIPMNVKRGITTLNEHERRFQRLVQASPVGLFSVNSKGHCLYTNSSYESLMGEVEVPLLSDSWKKMIHEADLNEVLLEWDKSLLEKQPFKSKCRIKTKNADDRWVMIIANVEKSRGGDFELVGSIIDINEHKKIEQSYAANEARFRLINSRLPGIVYQFKMDVDGGMSLPYVSPAVVNYLAVSAEAIMADASQWFGLTHPDDYPGLEASIGESMINLTQWEWEGRFIRKDGVTRWLHGSSTPQRMHDNSTVWDGVFIDVTERKIAETVLKKHQEHLEEMVEDRTKDYAIARDEAEKANQAKSDFLSSMSHELRTPMNAILGFGQLLALEESLTNTQSDCVAEIMLAGKHLLYLINDVLDLTKIESGNLDVDIENVDMTALFHQCLGLVKPLSDERNLSIINYIERDYWVRADINRLKQVMINILSNAVKYNTQGGKITTKVTRGELGGLRVSISDTGAGMTEAEMDRLFIRFQRLGKANTVEGLGIGLVISKELIELMGGRIGIESTIGEGSTFWFELPQGTGMAQD